MARKNRNQPDLSGHLFPSFPACAGAPPLRVCAPGSPLSLHKLLEHRVIQSLVGHQLLDDFFVCVSLAFDGVW